MQHHMRKGDPEALREAVETLRQDKVLAARLSNNAFFAFQSKHCIRAFAVNVVNAVNQVSSGMNAELR